MVYFHFSVIVGRAFTENSLRKKLINATRLSGKIDIDVSKRIN